MTLQNLDRYTRPGLLQLQSLPPLSLYIHMPWCIKKCPYCDFNSHAMPHGKLDESLQSRYLNALLADLDHALPLIWGRSVHSIFLGGGTPSLFTPQAIANLLSQVRARLRLSADCEITLEANPGSFERDRFKAFSVAGITRLSIGVQSFHDHHLVALGRVHTGRQARQAIEEAAQHFSTFNLDLMYALPSQSLSDLDQDLSTALAFDPPHLSVYHLTIEPNTYFAKFPPVTPDDDTAYAMLDRIIEVTAQHGLERYEVSAFSKQSHPSWHNTNYWQFGDYLGIGAGAHSKLSFAHRIVRQVRIRDPQSYMEKASAGQALAQEHDITHHDLAFEFMMNALRLKGGVPMQLFTERTGVAINAIEDGLKTARDQGLMTLSDQHLQATSHGFDFLSNLQELFLAPPKIRKPSVKIKPSNDRHRTN